MNKKINLINAFDASGTLRIKKLYTEIFDAIPDRFQYYKEDMLLDTTFFTVEKCKELFGSNIDVLIDSSEQYYSTSKAEEEGLKWNSEQNSFKRTTHPGVTVIHYDEEWIIEIDYNSITCYSHYKNMKPYVDIILNKCPSQEVKSKTATIDLVAFDHSYYTINSKIKKTIVDFDTHYNDDIKTMHKDLLAFLNERESGLAVIHGAAGTGNFLKNLLYFK